MAKELSIKEQNDYFKKIKKPLVWIEFDKSNMKWYNWVGIIIGVIIIILGLILK